MSIFENKIISLYKHYVIYKNFTYFKPLKLKFLLILWTGTCRPFLSKSYIKYAYYMSKSDLGGKSYALSNFQASFLVPTCAYSNAPNFLSLNVTQLIQVSLHSLKNYLHFSSIDQDLVCLACQPILVSTSPCYSISTKKHTCAIFSIPISILFQITSNRAINSTTNLFTTFMKTTKLNYVINTQTSLPNSQ